MKKTSTTGSRNPTPPRHIFTHWVTRDRLSDGTLSPKAKVWLARPQRSTVGTWSTTFLEDFYCEWTLEECIHYAKSYPDDDRQCIVVGGKSVKGPTDVVDRSPR